MANRSNPAQQAFALSLDFGQIRRVEAFDQPWLDPDVLHREVDKDVEAFDCQHHQARPAAGGVHGFGCY